MTIGILCVQMILVVITVYFSNILATKFVLLPGFALGNVHVGLVNEDVRTVLGTFLLSHLVIFLISRFIHKQHAFATIPRTLKEIYFVIVATTVTSCYLFLFTAVSFNANFFFYAYLTGPLCYLVGLLLVGWAQRANKQSHVEWLKTTPFRRYIWDFLWCRGAAVVGVVMLAPGFLAFNYKRSTDFRDLVNHTRVTFNFSWESSWELTDAYPGKTFNQPIDLRFVPSTSSEFYVLERPGTLCRIVTEPVWRKDVLLDITTRVGGTDVENGALSFALHPEFGYASSPQAGFVYVWYTHVQPGLQQNRLSRFDITLPDVSQRSASETILIDQGRLPKGTHNGGTVFFGLDGFLYLSIGDFGEGVQHGQRLDGPLASGIIRIDVDQRGGNVSRPIQRQPQQGKTAHYYIPQDNPFYGKPDVLEEFWVLGLRNPFRMSQDRHTGIIWLGDVGTNSYEEVNWVTKGMNGQWPYAEGREPTAHKKPHRIWGTEQPPYYVYPQTSLERAVIGGIVYRGKKYPELFGHYIFADNQSGLVRKMPREHKAPEAQIIARSPQLGQHGLTSLTETPSGDIFLTVLGSKQRESGQILRLIRKDGQSVPVSSAGLPQAGSEMSYEAVSDKYDMICSRCHGLDGKGTTHLARIPNFTAADWQQRVTDAHIKAVIIMGGKAMGLSPEMPSWDGVFSEAELAFLVQKIRAFGTASTQN